ncbi:MAG: hypothetical protein KAI66_15455 [Lentisphaeria bacterium]|nr:hypothetical protein [Lentisphaeria bacterium]
MKDEALERVWKSRKAISARCGFDSHQLVKYYQKRREKADRTRESSGLRTSAADS